MKSVMNSRFREIPAAEISRSSFDRSHGHKTTMNGGFLVPILVDEALPGDTFNCNMTGFGRLATPINPIMDNMFMETFFFAVPYRLVWDNWQRFNGEQIDPGDSTDYLIPTTNTGGGLAAGGLSDHMGIPPGVADLDFNSLWHRAYNLVYNEWFRSQDLQDSLPVPKGDGPDDISDFNLTRRGKRHDYFTSCLPWPQKGDAVLLPLGDRAPVASDANVPNVLGIQNSTGSPVELGANGANVLMTSDPGSLPDQLYVNLQDATSATINELREAFQIQKMLERDARGGTRYTEIIKSHFGVTSPDARLQRPEYLGGGSSPVGISQVPQTSATDPSGPDASPQGNLAAYGTVNVQNNGFTKSFTEHCLILGLCSVRADLTYQQGLDRMFSRQTRYDHYFPALAHIGEQAVLNKEIFAQGNATDEEVFGYQERHAEYRFKPSRISGLFRSEAAESLDVWHLSQDFGSLPTLNNDFIIDNPPIDRVVAVPDEPDFILDMYFKYICARPMPTYGTPGLIDHF